MATAKQVARDLLETLPEDCTLEDISYHLYVSGPALSHGRESIASLSRHGRRPAWTPTDRSRCSSSARARAPPPSSANTGPTSASPPSSVSPFPPPAGGPTRCSASGA